MIEGNNVGQEHPTNYCFGLQKTQFEVAVELEFQVFHKHRQLCSQHDSTDKQLAPPKLWPTIMRPGISNLKITNPLIAQLAERETVVHTEISRSPVRIRLRGLLFSFFFFFLENFPGKVILVWVSFEAELRLPRTTEQE